MPQKTYEIELKNNSGSETKRVKADSIESAFLQLESAYNVTRDSFGFWRVIPTKKQIKKTQGML